MANYLFPPGDKEQPLPCINSTSLQNYDLSSCCNLTNNWNWRHEPLLRILKYSIPSPHMMQSLEKVQKDFHDLEEILPYPNDLYNGTRLDVSKKYEFENRKTYNARIPICYKGHNDGDKFPTKCNMFVRSFTNQGIGFTFNAESFWNLHKKTDSNILFHDVMQPFLTYENDSKIFFPTSSAISQEITLVIERPDGNVDKSHVRYLESRSIKLSLHSPGSPSNMRDESTEVRPGYVTTIIIYPSYHTSTEAVHSLWNEKRNCRFPYENDGLKIYDKYSRNACLFECQISHGLKMCGCIPWDWSTVWPTLVGHWTWR